MESWVERRSSLVADAMEVVAVEPKVVAPAPVLDLAQMRAQALQGA